MEGERFKVHMVNMWKERGLRLRWFKELLDARKRNASPQYFDATSHHPKRTRTNVIKSLPNTYDYFGRSIDYFKFTV